MSIDTHTRQPQGVPAGGQFATTVRPEPDVSLTGIVSSISPETRQAILSDMQVQRGHMLLQLEALREEAERVATEQDGALRALGDLDQRIADYEAACAAGEGAPADPDAADRPTRYQGAGHVDDVVTVDGYGRFHRRRAGVYPDQPYQVRIQLGRELEPAEEFHLAQLVGYSYSRTGGERLGEPYRDAPNSIVMYMDTTKGRAYRHLEDRFENGLLTMIEAGSPVRTTDRNGPAGTRAVEGLGHVGGVELYYDSVTDGA